jgi:hypothetical protein
MMAAIFWLTSAIAADTIAQQLTLIEKVKNPKFSQK